MSLSSGFVCPGFDIVPISTTIRKARLAEGGQLTVIDRLLHYAQHREGNIHSPSLSAVLPLIPPLPSLSYSHTPPLMPPSDSLSCTRASMGIESTPVLRLCHRGLSQKREYSTKSCPGRIACPQDLPSRPRDLIGKDVLIILHFWSFYGFFLFNIST